ASAAQHPCASLLGLSTSGGCCPQPSINPLMLEAEFQSKLDHKTEDGPQWREFCLVYKKRSGTMSMNPLVPLFYGRTKHQPGSHRGDSGLNMSPGFNSGAKPLAKAATPPSTGVSRNPAVSP